MLHSAAVQILLFSLLCFPVQAMVVTEGSSEGMPYRVYRVTDDLDMPWGLAFVRPDVLLVTEKEGTAKLVSIKTGEIKNITGIPEVWKGGQGGLLDVAVPDSYPDSGWIYFTYSKNLNGQGATALARAKLEEESLRDWQDLLVTRSFSTTGRHFGSRITFDDQGHVFFSIGDRGVRENAQNRKNHAGAVLRINLDGTIPQDNPFIGRDGLPEIWSYGHRNIQGLFWDKSSSVLWANEHGPRGGDEINIIEKGLNYGWPVVSHGKEYWGPVNVGESDSKPGMEDPLKVYIPSIAPSSLLVYSGNAFPAWKGSIFSGALALKHLNRIVADKDGETREERLLGELKERIRDVIESTEGYLYLATDSGSILCLMPKDQ